MSISVLDLFKIGIGPSSSHTVGPMRAARDFAAALAQQDLCDAVRRLEVRLYGSLSATGVGHGTDRAVIAGLMGARPDEVDPDFPGHLAEGESARPPRIARARARPGASLVRGEREEGEEGGAHDPMPHALGARRHVAAGVGPFVRQEIPWVWASSRGSERLILPPIHGPPRLGAETGPSRRPVGRTRPGRGFARVRSGWSGRHSVTGKISGFPIAKRLRWD